MDEGFSLFITIQYSPKCVVPTKLFLMFLKVHFHKLSSRPFLYTKYNNFSFTNDPKYHDGHFIKREIINHELENNTYDFLHP